MNHKLAVTAFCLALAIATPFASAQAGEVYGCQPDPTSAVCDYYWDGAVDDDDEYLTQAERQQIARIKAGALKRRVADEARRGAEIEQQMKREAARRSQCTVPLLWIGCPPR
jgi:hypothetical protein